MCILSLSVVISILSLSIVIRCLISVNFRLIRFRIQWFLLVPFFRVSHEGVQSLRV